MDSHPAGNMPTGEFGIVSDSLPQRKDMLAASHYEATAARGERQDVRADAKLDPPR